jgi:hypothetical protein
MIAACTSVVEYHLRNVYDRLGISSPREQIRQARADDVEAPKEERRNNVPERFQVRKFAASLIAYAPRRTRAGPRAAADPARSHRRQFPDAGARLPRGC